MKRGSSLQLYDYQETGVQKILEALLHSQVRCQDGLYRHVHAFLLHDEMGLGKTIQTWETLRRLQLMNQLTGPSLVLCPSSCAHVWTKEDYATHFANDFHVHTTICDPSQLTSRDVVVLSYDMMLNIYKHYVENGLINGTLSNDEMLKYCQIYNKSIKRIENLVGESYRRELIIICKSAARKVTVGDMKPFTIPFMTFKWSVIIMDEVQKLKNPSIATSKAVAFLNAHYRLALSGTPVVNSGNDMISILQYALNLFHVDWEQIRLQPNSRYCTTVLETCTLGRRKADLREMSSVLPKRQRSEEEIILPWLDHYHKDAYIQVKNASIAVWKDMDALKRQPGESGIEYNQRRLALTQSFLSKMQKLRQICLHPDLPLYMQDQKPARVRVVWHPFVHRAFHPWIRQRIVTLLLCLKRVGCHYSIRLLLVRAFVKEELKLIQPSPKMMQLVPFLKQKMVVFSTFRVFLTAIMKPWLNQMGIRSVIFCGGSKRDQQLALKRFDEEEDVRVLLIVKGAGAEGLNLQRNCHVCFIMDPHFNSAMDEQAAQRIDRIGQQEEVIVRRLFMQGSIDEAMRQMQHGKRDVVESWVPSTTAKENSQRSLEAQGLYLEKYDTVN